MFYTWLQRLGFVMLLPVIVYSVFMSFVAIFPSWQHYFFYRYRVPTVNLKHLSTPERFGFLPDQVHPFFIEPTHSLQERLYAWHILSPEVCRTLTHQRKQNATIDRIRQNKAALTLLQSNKEARLVICFHGTAGCIASSCRPQSYQTVFAKAPYPIHVLAFDYRGYGLSSGTPSEQGLLQDGIAVVEWAMHVANIPPERIVIHGHSLGTAVALALTSHYAALPKPIIFSGQVLLAPFSDMKSLMKTYRIEGIVPIFIPLTKIPLIFNYFTSFLVNRWQSNTAIASYVHRVEESLTNRAYHIHLLHTQTDAILSSINSDKLFWHAVNASAPMTYEKLSQRKEAVKVHLDKQGWQVTHHTPHGLIRQTMLYQGSHERLMIHPIVSLAVLDAFAHPKTVLDTVHSKA